MVIPYIFKSKISQKFHFALKYSDLESCFTHCTAKDVYLEVWFEPNQAWRKSERDEIDANGVYRLVSISYHPTRSPLAGPWEDVSNPIVVSARVSPVPNEVATSTGLRRAILSSIVASEIRHISADGLFSRKWSFTSRLHSTDRAVECISKTWKGVRLEAQRRWLIPLPPSQNQESKPPEEAKI